MRRDILAYRAPETTDAMPHSGVAIISFVMACLAGTLTVLLWSGTHLRFWTPLWSAVFLGVIDVVILAAALLSVIGALDQGYRRVFAVRAIILLVVDVAALIFVSACIPA